MQRLGELIPDVARRLGMEEDLRRSRALAVFDALVAELVPACHGACRAVRIDHDALLVEADAPIVAQELRLRGAELLAAMASAPGGMGLRDMRIRVGPGRAGWDGLDRRV
jgi:hypothetical protein